MEEQDNKNTNNIDETSSGAQLLLHLGRLILLLLWKILRRGLKIVLKFLLILIDATEEAFDRLIDWWNDNDTQAKVAKIKATAARWWATAKRQCRIMARVALRWTTAAAVATAHGAVAAARATVHGIIHLKPTLIALYHLTVKALRATVEWARRCGRGMRLGHIRRKRAYQRFRRNKGLKGLLIDISRAVSNGITMFMEEDQQEAAPDAVTQDDLLRERIERISEDNKAAKLGQKLFSKAKSITDSESD